MIEQHRMSNGPLLDEDGNLIEAGYAFSLIKEYDRSKIKKGFFNIKEWDYYFVGDDKYGIALTIDDNSYMGLVSVSVLDFINKKDWTKSYIYWFPNGSVYLPNTSKEGISEKNGKNYEMKFSVENGRRHLICAMKNVGNDLHFKCDIYLEETSPNSMVIATPFKKRGHFYYNQKINNMAGEGTFSFGPISYKFSSSNTRGVLDWGRGVWTYSNTWYWSSLNTVYKGHNIGFNLGYGFGDTSAASENMLFVDKKVYKLDDVQFNIPKDKNGKESYLGNWTFTSKDGNINLIFEPLIDRFNNTNALLIQSNQHQIFGKFSGTFKVGKEEIEIKDVIGFAEKVKNRW